MPRGKNTKDKEKILNASTRNAAFSTGLKSSRKTHGAESQPISCIPGQNQKRPIVDHKSEACRAWKAYLSLSFDQYISQLEEEIEFDQLDLSEFECAYSLLEIGEYQSEILENIESLKEMIADGKRQFETNIALLDSGVEFDKLPLIDPDLTLTSVEQLIRDNYSIDVSLSRVDTDLSSGTSLSGGGTDSAIHDLESAIAGLTESEGDLEVDSEDEDVLIRILEDVDSMVTSTAAETTPDGVLLPSHSDQSSSSVHIEPIKMSDRMIPSLPPPSCNRSLLPVEKDDSESDMESDSTDADEVESAAKEGASCNSPLAVTVNRIDSDIHVTHLGDVELPTSTCEESTNRPSAEYNTKGTQPTGLKPALSAERNIENQANKVCMENVTNANAVFSAGVTAGESHKSNTKSDTMDPDGNMGSSTGDTIRESHKSIDTKSDTTDADSDMRSSAVDTAGESHKSINIKSDTTDADSNMGSSAVDTAGESHKSINTKSDTTDADSDLGSSAVDTAGESHKSINTISDTTDADSDMEAPINPPAESTSRCSAEDDTNTKRSVEFATQFTDNGNVNSNSIKPTEPGKELCMQNVVNINSESSTKLTAGASYNSDTVDINELDRASATEVTARCKSVIAEPDYLDFGNSSNSDSGYANGSPTECNTCRDPIKSSTQSTQSTDNSNGRNPGLTAEPDKQQVTEPFMDHVISSDTRSITEATAEASYKSVTTECYNADIGITTLQDESTDGLPHEHYTRDEIIRSTDDSDGLNRAEYGIEQQVDEVWSYPVNNFITEYNVGASYAGLLLPINSDGLDLADLEWVSDSDTESTSDFTTQLTSTMSAELNNNSSTEPKPDKPDNRPISELFAHSSVKLDSAILVDSCQKACTESQSAKFSKKPTSNPPTKGQAGRKADEHVRLKKTYRLLSSSSTDSDEDVDKVSDRDMNEVMRSQVCADWKENDEDDSEWTTVHRKRDRPKSESKSESESTEQNHTKSKQCLSHLSSQGCPNGDSCKISHDKPKLPTSKKKKTLLISSANTAAPMVPTHSEPCNKQQCLERLKYEKRRTSICTEFKKRGRCSRGKKCMFAHSESQLRPLPKHELCNRFFGSSPTCVKSSECVYAHSRAELRPPSPVPQKKTSKLSLKGDTKVATSSTKTVTGDIKTKLAHPEPCTRQFCPARLEYETRYTQMCPSTLQMGVCRTVGKCNDAHTLNELRPLPKYEMCSKYGGCGRCLPSDQCPYAHTRAEQRTRPQTAASANLPKPVQLQAPSVATSSSWRTAARNGASHTLQKIEVLNHPDPCPDQQCPTRLLYERRKTVMCPVVGSGGHCESGTQCPNAHSLAELRLLPKREMCKRLEETGKCIKSSECVYAHSLSELRSPTASILRCPRLTNQMLATSAVTYFNDNGSSQAGYDYDEECVICFTKLDDRIDLECGHDCFHFRCISKWLNEGRAECPLCNHPAMLPDVFEAPLGMKAADFPSLGL